MRYRTRIAVFVFLLFQPVWTHAVERKMAVPAYVPPGSPAWNTWQSLGSQTLGLMVMNLGNGDKPEYRAETAAAVERARRQGISVLAYTYSSYGKRDPAIIRSKIDAIYRYYAVDGIFVDETPTDCDGHNDFLTTHSTYYAQLSAYIRTKAGRHIVVLNPGTMPPADCWMPMADILLTHENKGLNFYRTEYKEAAWTRNYPSERFWHLVYAVSNEDELKEVVKLARERHVGYLYVTHDADANPWDEVPPYLTAEAEAWTGHVGSLQPAGRAKPVAIRFRAPKGTKQQIFIDIDQKVSTGYQSPILSVGADFLIELPGDGTASLMRYAGTGSDWNWTRLPVPVQLVSPAPDVNMVAFDSEPLGNARTAKLQCITLDSGWNPLHITDVVRWEVTK